MDEDIKRIMNERNYVEEMPAELTVYYQDACNEYEKQGVFFLTESYILSMQEKYNVFPNILSEVLSGVNKLAQDRDVAIYVLFVYKLMVNAKFFVKYSPMVDFTGEYPLLPLFCMLPTIETTYMDYANRNIPQDVIKATMTAYEQRVLGYLKKNGNMGLSKGDFDHLLHYVGCIILHVERLVFVIMHIPEPIYVLRKIGTNERVVLFNGGEMKSDGLYKKAPPQEAKPAFHTRFEETATEYIGNRVLPTGRCESTISRYSKNEYELLLKPGDDCLSTHIPASEKGGLTKEACDLSYQRAIEIMQNSYPELNVKAIRCESWLLSQELKEILPKKSNIIYFQNRYMVYPSLGVHGKAVFTFAFNNGKYTDYRELPEDTSLQRAIKSKYLQGEYIYEYAGVFMTNDFIKEKGE